MKRFGVLSVAKIYAICMAVMGILYGAIYGLVFGFAALASGSVGLAIGIGFLTFVGVPVLFGMSGFITGLIGAWLYNIIAGWVGGIEVELKK